MLCAVKAKDITFHRKKNLQYYDISARSNYNFEKPFLYLARKLAGYIHANHTPLQMDACLCGCWCVGACNGCRDPELRFVAAPALVPADVPVDTAAMAANEKLMEEATKTALPDDGTP